MLNKKAICSICFICLWKSKYLSGKQDLANKVHMVHIIELEGEHTGLFDWRGASACVQSGPVCCVRSVIKTLAGADGQRLKPKRTELLPHPLKSELKKREDTHKHTNRHTTAVCHGCAIWISVDPALKREDTPPQRQLLKKTLKTQRFRTTRDSFMLLSCV